MHKEYKYFSVIRQPLSNICSSFLTKKPCLMQEHRRYLLCKPSYSLLFSSNSPKFRCQGSKARLWYNL